eukprot:CAMPEP_0182862560 /NCGR_PEP_ID=MMETSP0034_2-20130328/6138_1 /TAXON_ID=156128 /ORGANISM="Nephroselmis pyriformis, Strain CCMP717" /LENGTH=71 /DNA_ID=CAMNT_0024994639 /DNA_START=430 /DNA_END=641 /DNA_ORIENTATION=+
MACCTAGIALVVLLLCGGAWRRHGALTAMGLDMASRQGLRGDQPGGEWVPVASEVYSDTRGRGMDALLETG